MDGVDFKEKKALFSLLLTIQLMDSITKNRSRNKEKRRLSNSMLIRYLRHSCKIQLQMLGWYVEGRGDRDYAHKSSASRKTSPSRINPRQILCTKQSNIFTTSSLLLCELTDLDWLSTRRT